MKNLPMWKQRWRGFTLIELMIVVAIVAIIAAIAYPNYQEQTRKAKRGDAKSALMKNAQFMEKFYTENKAYLDSGGNAPTLPFTKSPDEGTTAYNVSFSGSVTATTYAVQAVPTGTQASDKCGTLTLNHLGVKGVTGAASGWDASKCW